MRWLLLSGLIVCLSCTNPTTYQASHDPPDYVDRVIEDVTAMLEGMAAAHSVEQMVLRDPNVPSVRQPKMN